MCYLPLGCLKFVVGVGAVLSIIISLGLLAVTIYANVQKKSIISNTGGQIVNDALVGLYLGAAIFMVLGICGVYGAMRARKKQQNSGNCFLFFYLLGVFVFLVLFIAATIFFFVGPQVIFKDDCKHGSKTLLVDELYNLTQKAQSELCIGKCPCYFKNDSSDLAALLRSTYPNFNTTSDQNFVQYQACLTQEESKNPNILLMGAIEEMLGCAGWCPEDTPKFYKFYDINKCDSAECMKGKEGCYVAFKSFLTGNGILMGYACSIATLVCLINVVTVCCICFHPSKTKRGSNFYARMMEDD